MKTRIQVIELNNGTKKYNPQAKKYLLADYKNLIMAGGEVDAYNYSCKKLNTLQEAQHVIDSYIEFKKEQKLLSTKKVTYIKYP